MFLPVSSAFAFAFGAVIGSFLNVVIHRVPLGESIVSPPSHCPKCGSGIRWYDNIPIVSWLVLSGECRNCSAPISPRYAAVEGLMGLLSAMLWLKLAPPMLTVAPSWAMMDWQALMVAFFLYFTFVALCVTIAFIDLEHLIIPHELSIPGIILGLASPWIIGAIFAPHEILQLWPPISPSLSLIGAIAGALSVISIFVLYFMLRGIAGMGGGDVTLMAMAGAWLGWPALIFIFFAASIQGLIATVIAQVTGISLIHDAEDIFAEDEEEAPEDDADEGDAAATDEDDAGEEREGEGEDEATAEAAGEDDDAGEDEPGEEDADAGEDEGDSETSTSIEIIEDEDEVGPMAIPFGPFIVLSALEHFYLGPLMPEGLSMVYMYFY